VGGEGAISRIRTREHGGPIQPLPTTASEASFAGEIECRPAVGTPHPARADPSVEEAETVIRTQPPTAEQAAASTRRWWVEPRHASIESTCQSHRS
jgi:hypothetical protein